MLFYFNVILLSNAQCDSTLVLTLLLNTATFPSKETYFKVHKSYDFHHFKVHCNIEYQNLGALCNLDIHLNTDFGNHASRTTLLWSSVIMRSISEAEPTLESNLRPCYIRVDVKKKHPMNAALEHKYNNSLQEMTWVWLILNYFNINW